MRPNQKPNSLSNFDYHMAWKKYISKDHPILTKGINRGVLLGYCHLLADSGSHGVKCKASDTTIGDQMEIGRDTIAKYKREAVRIGWFIHTGVFGQYNSPIFDIAIPDHDPTEFDPASKTKRKGNLGSHLNDGTKRPEIKPKPLVIEVDHQAAAKPVSDPVATTAIDPWEFEGTRKTPPTPTPQPKPKTGPGHLWGEAAMAENKANAPDVDDSAAPTEHSGQFPGDCQRCQWYTFNRHPKESQVHEEHVLVA